LNGFLCRPAESSNLFHYSIIKSNFSLLLAAK
jgi:hypothetical protein